ncbi:MAG: hypothetical protein U0574_12120 [Phycisphaerales bacterium]
MHAPDADAGSLQLQEVQWLREGLFKESEQIMARTNWLVTSQGILLSAYMINSGSGKLITSTTEGLAIVPVVPVVGGSLCLLGGLATYAGLISAARTRAAYRSALERLPRARSAPSFGVRERRLLLACGVAPSVGSPLLFLGFWATILWLWFLQ